MKRNLFISRQQGAILFFALIILFIMTMIGTGLALNSGMTLRMAGAGTERLQALSAVKGAQSNILSDPLLQKQLANISTDFSPEISIATDTLNSTTILHPLHKNDVNCQRTSQAHASNLVSCRRLEMHTSTTFGRHNLGSVTVISGIEQEILTGS